MSLYRQSYRFNVNLCHSTPRTSRHFAECVHWLMENTSLSHLPRIHRTGTVSILRNYANLTEFVRVPNKTDCCRFFLRVHRTVPLISMHPGIVHVITREGKVQLITNEGATGKKVTGSD